MKVTIRHARAFAWTLAAVCLGWAATADVQGFDEPEHYDVFPAVTGGYQNYRTPVLVRPSSGTLLAFAECKQTGWR